MNPEKIKRYKKSDLGFLRKMNDQKHVRAPMENITDYIEGNRILPPGTPMPGPFSYDTTPYLVEPQNDLSPATLVNHVSVMKGVQIGATTSLVENTVGFYIGECPAEVLLISATNDLLKEWMEIRAEPLLDSLSLRKLIFAQSGNTKSRKTGDTATKKQYPGGQLDLASARAAPKLRMKSKRVVLLDEVDGAPAELTTGEGSFVSVAEGRTVAFGHRAKICLLSTPSTYEKSIIWIYYQEGDQRHYFMPCPHCDKEMTFLWEYFRADVVDGYCREVWVECPHCEKKIFNHHKTQMLPAGKWKPTAKSVNKFRRSYYMPAFLSPVGMLDWMTIYERYLKAQDDNMAMASWTNLYCGLPFKELGIRPKVDNVIELKGGYKSREVPSGVLFLTMFVDVQRGSKKDKANPPRLEMEVCGHGAGYRTWSIDYIVVKGEIDDAYSGAWDKLNQLAVEGKFRYARNDGFEFGLDVVLLDSGDGVYMHTVYEFSGRWDNTFPSKGFRDLGRQAPEKGDQLGRDNARKYRVSKMTEGVMLHEISTNFYKRMLYRNLGIKRIPGALQKPCFCDFPRDYSKRYFEMLTAEELREDGSFHAGGRRNEAMDCRVGNMCAADVFLDAMVADFRLHYQKEGLDKWEVQNQIRTPFVLEYLAQLTARVGVVDAHAADVDRKELMD